MKTLIKGVCAGVGAMLATGCLVQEEHPHRRVYYEREAPPPVVVQEEQPADVVEVVPVQPGPEYVYVGGGWHREGRGWVWHHGYWRH